MGLWSPATTMCFWKEWWPAWSWPPYPGAHIHRTRFGSAPLISAHIIHCLGPKSFLVSLYLTSVSLVPTLCPAHLSVRVSRAGKLFFLWEGDRR